jgi:hypothetical protein
MLVDKTKQRGSLNERNLSFLAPSSLAKIRLDA